jgi:hypothetical protein
VVEEVEGLVLGWKFKAYGVFHHRLPKGTGMNQGWKFKVSRGVKG